MTFRGQTIATPGAVLALICFFLPWVSQSCGNQAPRVSSGWQLTADGDRLVLLVPIGALAVLVLALAAWRRGYATRVDSLVSIGLGALALLFLLLKFGGRVPEGATRDLLYGLWGVVAGNIVIVLGGIVHLFTLAAPRGARGTVHDDTMPKRQRTRET
jgi:hypothetical protein